jgi:hypothetical protein
MISPLNIGVRVTLYWAMSGGTQTFPHEANNRQEVAVALVAQGIHNHIRFLRVIVNLQITILDKFQPSSLGHVQIGLSENVHQAFVVDLNMDHIPKKIVSPCP